MIRLEIFIITLNYQLQKVSVSAFTLKKGLSNLFM